jgi:hypothetical protein
MGDIRTDTNVKELRGIEDSDGQEAHAASDERLEELRAQGANGSLQQQTINVENTPPNAYDVPDGTVVEVQAHADNSGIVYVGDSDAQERALGAREFVDFAVDDLAAIHARGTAGDRIVLSWSDPTA